MVGSVLPLVSLLGVRKRLTHGQATSAMNSRSDPPVVRVHLTAATLDAAAAVCHVRGLPHLVLLLDRAATEIRQQEGETND